MIGWLKIHREIKQWEWYKDANTFRVFFHLLVSANFEPSRYMGVAIPIGSLPTGRDAIARDLGISADKVRTALSHLKSTGEITSTTHAKFSVITITKWASYQTDPQQVPSKSPASPQQVPTLKEGKKERTTPLPPEGELYGRLYGVFPKKRKGSFDNGAKAWSKAILRDTPANIISGALTYADSEEATKENARFASGLASWLNDDGWRKQWTPTAKAKTGFGRAGL